MEGSRGEEEERRGETDYLHTTRWIKDLFDQITRVSECWNSKDGLYDTN